MFVRSLRDVDGSDRDVRAPTWRSRRLVLARDGLRFSLHDTIIDAGTVTEMCYKHHVEAVYCIEGSGVLDDLATGATHRLEPGVCYVLDDHDRHRVTAHTQLRMVCVFDPPVTGDEVHDADGAYPAPAPNGGGGA